MNTIIDSRKNASELQKNLLVHLQELAEDTDKARQGEEMIRYLEFCSRFYHYSANNIWLIILQKPDCTYVAGYVAWQKMGRQVVRGSKGIVILAPMLVKKENADGEYANYLVGFKPATVFDVSQTSGDPLPPQPNWKSLSQNDELRRRMTRFAESKCIIVVYENLDSETQGVSMGGRILLRPGSGVKTLAHELGHELLHRKETIPLSHLERELEAESVAFIVCRHFGILNMACPNYNALHGATGELILQHFQRILGAAVEIINFVEGME
jgi:hypothetical protein